MNDNKEGDMCGTFMNVMEGVADALRSINQVCLKDYDHSLGH